MTTLRPVYPEDWGVQLEADYDEYMERLYNSVDAEDQDAVLDEDCIDVTGNYFCGCSVCERRASWTWLMVRICTAYRDGLIELEEEEDDPPSTTDDQRPDAAPPLFVV